MKMKLIVKTMALLMVFSLIAPEFILNVRADPIIMAATNDPYVKSLAIEIAELHVDFKENHNNLSRSEKRDRYRKIYDKSILILNKVTPKKRVEISEIFSKIRRANIDRDYDNSVALQQIIMFLTLRFSDKEYNLYRDSLSLEIKKNGNKNINK